MGSFTATDDGWTPLEEKITAIMRRLGQLNGRRRLRRPATSSQTFRYDTTAPMSCFCACSLWDCRC